jgi:hypothetical protein
MIADLDIRVTRDNIARLEGCIARTRLALEALGAEAPPLARTAKRDALATFEHQLAEERAALAYLTDADRVAYAHATDDPANLSDAQLKARIAAKGATR